MPKLVKVADHYELDDRPVPSGQVLVLHAPGTDAGPVAVTFHHAFPHVTPHLTLVLRPSLLEEEARILAGATPLPVDEVCSPVRIDVMSAELSWPRRT